MENKLTQIWEDLESEFDLSNIRECSFGGPEGKKIHLVDSNKVAFNFDKVTEVWAKEKLKCHTQAIPKSVDCVYVEEDYLFLVEFKNTTKIDNSDVKAKIHDSLSLLNYFYTFEQLDFQRIEVVLVRKEKESTSKELMHKRLNQLSNSSCPPSLDFLQKVYRIKISKMTCHEFLQYI